MSRLDQRIRHRPCTGASEWDDLAGRVPWATAQHTFGYGQALASCFGFLRPKYLVFESGERVVAGLPLFRFSVGRPFHSLHSLPFQMYGGPLVDPEFVCDSELMWRISQQIETEAIQHDAFEACFVLPPCVPEQVHQCFQSSDRTVLVRRQCLILSLDRPLDAVVRGYKPSVRRAIAKSRRERIVVEVNPQLDHLYEAYPLYRARMRKIGATAKPWRFLVSVLEKGLGASFLARRDGKCVGVLILLVNSRYAFYWISGWEQSVASARPMNALFDAAIRWCHERGVPSLSFGETHGGRAGLVRFKEGWGPRPAQSTVVVRTYRPWIQKAWNALEPLARGTYAILCGQENAIHGPEAQRVRYQDGD